ncbi:hypothetical protein SBADM41S_02359 [Streptomyces badius]
MAALSFPEAERAQNAFGGFLGLVVTQLRFEPVGRRQLLDFGLWDRHGLLGGFLAEQGRQIARRQPVGAAGPARVVEGNALRLQAGSRTFVLLTVGPPEAHRDAAVRRQHPVGAVQAGLGRQVLAHRDGMGADERRNIAIRRPCTRRHGKKCGPQLLPAGPLVVPGDRSGDGAGPQPHRPVGQAGGAVEDLRPPPPLPPGDLLVHAQGTGVQDLLLAAERMVRELGVVPGEGQVAQCVDEQGMELVRALSVLGLFGEQVEPLLGGVLRQYVLDGETRFGVVDRLAPPVALQPAQYLEPLVAAARLVEGPGADRFADGVVVRPDARARLVLRQDAAYGLRRVLVLLQFPGHLHEDPVAACGGVAREEPSHHVALGVRQCPGGLMGCGLSTVHPVEQLKRQRVVGLAAPA